MRGSWTSKMVANPAGCESAIPSVRHYTKKKKKMVANDTKSSLLGYSLRLTWSTIHWL